MLSSVGSIYELCIFFNIAFVSTRTDTAAVIKGRLFVKRVVEQYVEELL